jgi:hypothetical protein
MWPLSNEAVPLLRDNCCAISGLAHFSAAPGFEIGILNTDFSPIRSSISQLHELMSRLREHHGEHIYGM